ncbi:MAG TPA: ATP-binding protein [Steroidobacteraceae bacterium]|nr:ATP-binding protein [Steroidobacteraceae bacterium]
MKSLLTSQTATDSSQLAWRVLTLVNLFRLLVAVLLTVMFLTITPTRVGQAYPGLFIGATAAYFAYALLSIATVKRRWPEVSIQAVVGLCVDVLAIATLTYASGGMTSGLASLLVLPIGATSFIVRQRLALMFAAIATLAVLVQQTLTALAAAGDSGDFASAGIVGALIFIVTLGIGPLARNLRESEERVRQREVDVANLAELNQFIVQHLRESILVVDANDTIRLINESAALLLHGASVPQGTPLGEVSPRLLYLLATWRKRADDWQLTTLTMLASDGGSLVQPHFVSLDSSGNGPTLVFLEDTTLIVERVQQSKLAALGRLSASIAHEIRNPVGAMSHAAQLLAEAPTLTTQERRLADIITSNGERVSTIINNVLQLSRRDTTRPERIELTAWLGEFLAEFHQTSEVDQRTIRLLDTAGELDVRVDPSHLYQLLWNLCENALKYGRRGDNDAPVELRTGRITTSDRPFLEVVDRGPGIEAGDAERIFEPFFTGSKGGTGLGLFIARELAQCNRAALIYEPRSGGGSIFRVVFADPQRWEIS